MRVAALYDIHGNLPALEAVLTEVRQASIDLLLIGGDVFPGPMSNDTLACLLDQDMPVRFIRGNGDRDVLALAAGREAAGVPEQYLPTMRWVAQRLDGGHRRLIATWPQTVRLEIDGLGDVLFCHATPRSDTEIFTRLTPEERLRPVFDGLNTALVICGHTHMQFDRTIGDVRVVNAGSVGMPFGEPGAYWVVLGPDVHLRQTRYDPTRAAERIRATDYPQAREFAECNVLTPPSEKDMLEVFARAELK